ncbi:MAG: hypothetical protein Q8M95_14545 [Candidatus Methanoperedens sp.]|nr:hypothetical protein [Candidatus Methanoperedens sp.]
MVIPPELIEQISSMGIKDLLTFLASGKAGLEAIAYIKEKIREKLDERKYGFVPNAEETRAIYEINKKEVYQRLKVCLGGHWALDLLRVGIYISKLNDEGKRETVRKIKDHVYSKYGPRGIKIIDMGATSVIGSVASYLSDRKMRDNMNPLDLALEFDKLIEGWDKVTIFVKKDENESSIYKKVMSYMDNYPLFFVFAYGSAVMIASKAIAKLNNERTIQQKRYFFYVYPNFDQAGLQNNAWVFELIPRNGTMELF